MSHDPGDEHQPIDRNNLIRLIRERGWELNLIAPDSPSEGWLVYAWDSAYNEVRTADATPEAVLARTLQRITEREGNVHNQHRGIY